MNRMAAFICVLIAGCSAHQSLVKNLPACWNVNALEAGPVAGRGIFITSMHGMGLQSPGCDDRKGRNVFELQKSAKRDVREYLIAGRRERFVVFSFKGIIDRQNGSNKLIIEQVEGLQGADKPQWLTDLERSYSGRATK